MAQKLKFGNGTWATKKGSTLAYNDENNNYKPLPFTTTRDSIATRVNKEGLIEVVGKDKPRIDYTDSAEGVLLLENSATNYVKHSESIDSWSTSFSSLSPNAITADYEQGPYSNTNADRVQLTINPSNTVSQIFQVLPLPSGVHTASVWLKSLSGTPTISIIDGYNTVGSFKLVTLTNEWVRHTLTFTATSSDFIPQFLLINGTTSLSADFLVYGFQVEQGSYATSYIPTNGSSVQRAADTASGAGNSEVFSDSQGVLFANIAALVDDSTLRKIQLNDNTANNNITIDYYTSSNSIRANLWNGSSQYSYVYTLTDVTLSTKVAFLYKSSEFKFYVNGIKVNESSSGSTFSSGTLKTLDLSTSNGSFPFYGKTKEIGYYDEILTDLELETLTSYRSLNELVTELNLNEL